MKYRLELRGVAVSVSIVDTGRASDEVLGDSVVRFSGAEAEALAGVEYVEHTLAGPYGQTLRDRVEDCTGEPWDGKGVLALDTDAGIAALSILLDRGDPFSVEFDLAEGSEFWAFHDFGHALDDFSPDWNSRTVDAPAPGELSAWVEDRANLTGADLALRAGLSPDEVLGTLLALRPAFAARFYGRQSQAFDSVIADLRAGRWGEVDGLEWDAEAVVDELAAEAVELSDPDDSPDTVGELGRELGENGDAGPAWAVLAALSDWDTLGEYGGDPPGLDDRASYALGGAVEARARELAECSRCSDRRIPGSNYCSDCSDSE